ncbi:gamma-glutamyltransferase [Serratia symbiotica]|uniref:gamma-glutamyltransferase n=1 Tax=Serratia symbiotica TaxID=138074 RepID=UPI003CC8AD70
MTLLVGEKNFYGLIQGTVNSIAPGKHPLSSMTPTLVTKDNKMFMVVGSPGGSRIITITLQTALNVIDHGMAPQEVVDEPRIHHQWLQDVMYYEKRCIYTDTLKRLKDMGYKMVEQTPWGRSQTDLDWPTRRNRRQFLAFVVAPLHILRVAASEKLI